ncbi:conserved hypothetical protein [Lodderomyces elongisporus NRRL YB-4239]|uniref:CBS domain-containing protein n=1 Tax=Lodderomyces elongisporus (strain ATCC 11503 / CBS 2605 / JCM 1781 / NBRC 1676 / NRRL YB-4239) TaxID=379508 RepID=A5DYL0_LODEL|nr:conserved hypothetical protein [Lodderomyces elongisporus NRRL YB-4239]
MTTTPILFHTQDYRGATIEDLNIPQALSVNPSTSIYGAIELGFENEFTYLPVIHELNKRLLGVINLEQFKQGTAQINHAKQEPTVFDYMIWFNQNTKRKYETEIRNNKNIQNGTGEGKGKGKILETTSPKTKILKPKGKRYSVLTPFSPLEDLAGFFNRGNYFAIVTNDLGNFVYGVVTPQDLMKYEQSRPKL